MLWEGSAVRAGWRGEIILGLWQWGQCKVPGLSPGLSPGLLLRMIRFVAGITKLVAWIQTKRRLLIPLTSSNSVCMCVRHDLLTVPWGKSHKLCVCVCEPFQELPSRWRNVCTCACLRIWENE